MIPLHKMVSPYWNYIWCMRARPTVFCNCKRLVFASDHLTSDVKYYDKYILSNRRVLKCLTKIEINFCYKLHVWLNCNTCQLYSNEVFLVVVLLGTSDKTLSSTTDWGRPSQLTGAQYDCLLVVVMVTTWSRAAVTCGCWTTVDRLHHLLIIIKTLYCSSIVFCCCNCPPESSVGLYSITTKPSLCNAGT